MARRTRVLVATDDADLRRYLQRSLARMKGSAFETLLYADSAAAALEIARRTRPSLAIIDEDLGSPGKEHLVTTLSGRPETAAIPVLLLAGSRTLHGPRSHAGTLLSKPFNAQKLEVAIRSALGTGGPR